MYPVEEFKVVLQKQMARCDRVGKELSLVVFEPASPGESRLYLQHVAKMLQDRIRCIDEIGWFERMRIGVLLPDTPHEGARGFAEEVTERLAAKGMQAPTFTVYIYPSEDVVDEVSLEDVKSRRSIKQFTAVTPPS